MILRGVWNRLKATVSRSALDREFDDEVRLHLEMLAEENMDRGMTPEEARLSARRSFGGVEQVKEVHRDRRGFPCVDSLRQDVLYGLRMLRRSPGFTAVAALTLALGIGATTTVFSVVNAVIMRPLRFPDSDRLMVVLGAPRDGNSAYPPMEAQFMEWRDRSRSFETIAGAVPAEMVLSAVEQPRFVRVASATFDFFRLIGVRPIFGRTFGREEDRPGSDLALLDGGFWQREYGGDPNVLGTTILLNEKAYMIIGVLPPDIRFADFGARDVWVPLAPRPSLGLAGRGAIITAGRLRPGVTRQAAQSEMDAITRQVWGERTGNRLPAAVVKPLRDWVVGDVRRSFLMLLGAVSLVLLICCANVANLLLARSTARHKEMAIRAALGAGRWRLVRQTLIESLLLAGAGGAMGVALAFAAVRAIPAISAIEIPRVEEIAVDRVVLLGAAVLSMASGLLFGLAPALQIARRQPGAALHSVDTAKPLGAQRLRNTLVAAQMAIALVLLCGAGLMTNSLLRLLRLDLGFEPSRVLSIETSLPHQRYDQKRKADFCRRLAAEVRGMPGVEAVSAASYAPLQAVHGGYLLTPEKGGSDRKFEVLGRDVDPGYLRVLGIPLIAGRDLEYADDARRPAPALLNRSAAKALFGDANPIGQRLKNGERLFPLLEVVGVVGDVRMLALAAEPGPQVYLSLVHGYAHTVVVRTAANAGDLRGAIRNAVHALDSSLPAPDIEAMDARISEQTVKPRFYLAMLGAFAAAGLLLAAMGVYGVISYTVARRTHEFGVRMALGAREGDILRLVLGAGARVICAGAALGIAGALAATRALSSLLYGVRPGDPVTFACVLALLLGVALSACYIAARRATGVDPNRALRCE